MNTQLVLGGRRANVVGVAGITILVRQVLRYEEHGNAANAFRCTIDAGQNQVHDVFRNFVVAPGNVNLRAEYAKGITVPRCAGSNGREVRPGLRFRQVHRALPLARR